MAFRNGKQIRDFDAAEGPSVMGIRVAGERAAVLVVHMSRETLNLPPKPGVTARLKRDDRREKRKVRMRLRRRRGRWC